MAWTASASPSTTKPVTPSSTTSATEPDRNAITGVPHAMASIITRPKGSGQSIGNSKAEAPARNFCLAASSTSPISRMVAVDLRFKPFLEVTPLPTWYFRRDAKRHSGGARNADCGLRALLGGEPAEKGKVRSAFDAGAKQIGRQTVIHGTKPVRIAKRGALIVRNRNEGSARKAADNIRQTRQIQTAMHSGDEWHAEPAKQWQMQPVDMGVDHVKLGGLLRHRFQQDCLCRNRIGTRSAESKRARPDRMKLCARH